jgi:hypothetical protein
MCRNLTQICIYSYYWPAFVLKCKMFNIFQERRIRNFSIHIRKNFNSYSYYFTGAK